jgi:hypothetical protein
MLCVGCDMDTLEMGFGYTGSVCCRPKPNYEIALRGKFKAVSPNCVTVFPKKLSYKPSKFLSLAQRNDVSTTLSMCGELKVSLYMFSGGLVFCMHTYSIHIFMSKIIAACHITCFKLEVCNTKWQGLIAS